MGRPLKRLDKALVEGGYADSRIHAQELIKGGNVRVAGFVAEKPASLVPEGAKIEVETGGREWVSRGAYKLLKGLETWDIDPTGSSCIDIGASTGGFTDVLLSRGAQRVAAVDVGYGQLAWKLRQDPRVIVYERTNARYISEETIGWQAELIVSDASFISLRLLLPTLQGVLKSGGEMILLVKPQFEVGRERVGRGVVRDPLLHLDVLVGLSSFIAESTALVLRGATYSPIRGPEGNIEFLFYLYRAYDDADANEKKSMINFENLVEEAHKSVSQPQ